MDMDTETIFAQLAAELDLYPRRWSTAERAAAWALAFCPLLWIGGDL
jgi:hypothetical protein